MTMYGCQVGEIAKKPRKSLMRWAPNICSISRRPSPASRPAHACCAGCFQSNQTARRVHTTAAIGIRIIANAHTLQTLHPSQWQAERKTKLPDHYRHATPRSRDWLEAYLGLTTGL